MSQSKQRSVNFAKSEEEKLLTMVLEKRKIFENKKTDTVSSRQKDAAWEKLAQQFNASSETNIIRSAKALKEKYNNMKKTMRKASKHEVGTSANLADLNLHKAPKHELGTSANLADLKKQILEEQLEHARLEHEQRMMHAAEEHALRMQILEAELELKQM